MHYSWSSIFCRISRARRVVENAFGILSSRFRVLRSPLLQNYKNSLKTVKAAVTLHNYILQNCNSAKNYLDPEKLKTETEAGTLSPGFWEEEGNRLNLHSLGHLSGNRSGSKTAREQRDRLAQLMMTDGMAPWQFSRALRCQWTFESAINFPA